MHLYTHDRSTYRRALRRLKKATDEVAALSRSIRSTSHHRGQCLDIGAGNGELYHRLRWPRQHITAIEPDVSMARHLRRRGVVVRQQTWESWVPDRTYRLIVAAHVFYYFPRRTWQRHVRTIVSALEPGGRAYIILNAPRTGVMDQLRRLAGLSTRSTTDAKNAAVLRRAIHNVSAHPRILQPTCHARFSAWSQFAEFCQFHLELPNTQFQRMLPNLKRAYEQLPLHRAHHMLEYKLLIVRLERQS